MNTIRYEASLEGIPVIGESFTNFNERTELEKIFHSLNLDFELVDEGRGGYYVYDIKFNNIIKAVHIYLKRITFGGRDNLPYEKRVQFSAAIDRRGFIKAQIENIQEFNLILGIYKYDDSDNVIMCAWDIHDWGHNFGRAFNCFVNIKAIAAAFRDGFSQHKSSKGQIVCCFTPDRLMYYLGNSKKLHEQMIDDSKGQLLKFLNLTDIDNSEVYYRDEIPKYSELFQLTIDILKKNNGVASTDTIEFEAGKVLNLTESVKMEIHNESEGYRTKLGYQLAWSRFYLKKSEFVENPARGVWTLTESGWNLPVNKTEIVRRATAKDISKEVDDEFINSNREEFEIETETESSNIDILNPFDPNKVDIRTRNMTLDLILKRLNTNAIDMNTSFQRNANLWSFTKQSRLIESILVKFPLPAFYFDGSNDEKWLVVDGLQRLSSLDNFVNKEAFTLTNLEFLNQFNNYKFSELPGHLQRRIEEFEITAYVIAAGTPKELKFNVFKRINTGGLTLTSQEIRHAIFQGKAIDFIKKLSNLRSFKMATAYSIPEDRLLDQEFINRFMAFYLYDISEYDSDLDGFMNKALHTINSDITLDLELIETSFDQAMRASLQIFGEHAFRKQFFPTDKRKPINKALFEVWSVLLSKLDSSETEILVDRKYSLVSKFMELLNLDEDFLRAITSGTNDKYKVRKRFTEIKRIIDTTIFE